MIRIIGVDPGSSVTGFGVIDSDGKKLERVHSGVIRMKGTVSLPERLRRIYDGLAAEIVRHKPDEFCIETAFYGKNIQSTLKLGQVRGVAILAAVHSDLPFAEYSPREVKHSVTGTGAAAKQQIGYMVKVLLGLEKDFKHSDEADGLALAICHAFHMSTPQSQYSSWKEYVEKHPERVRT